MSMDLNRFDDIIVEIQDVVADEAPDGMVVLLIDELSPEELAIEPKYTELIKEAVKKNKAFEDIAIINYLKGLPLFYLLGIEKKDYEGK